MKLLKCISLIHSLTVVFSNDTYTPEENWTTKIKHIHFEIGYGFVWLNQNVSKDKTNRRTLLRHAHA